MRDAYHCYGFCRGLQRKAESMLVLSRKRNEQIVIGDRVVITIIEIRGDKVRLGIEAPADVPVHRQEVFEAIRRNNSTRGDAPLEA